MSTGIALSDALIRRGNDWAQTAWRNLPLRNAGLGWNMIAQTALPLVSESSGKYHKPFSQELMSDSSKFHESTRGTLWYNPGTEPTSGFWEHNHAYGDSTRDHRLNVTALMLSQNIASNEDKLAGRLTSLPERNTKNLHYWKSLGPDFSWSWASNCGNIKPPFDIDKSPEASVRWSIQAAWQNLNKNYFEDEKVVPHLRWENTAICALDAVYDTIRYLHEAQDPTVIEKIAEKLHGRDMITYSLWGKDTLNSDRTDSNKAAKLFQDLSQEMKENYILIVLATLSGISDFMTVGLSNAAVKAA